MVKWLTRLGYCPLEILSPWMNHSFFVESCTNIATIKTILLIFQIVLFKKAASIGFFASLIFTKHINPFVAFYHKHRSCSFFWYHFFIFIYLCSAKATEWKHFSFRSCEWHLIFLMVLSLLILFHFSDLLKVPKQFSLFSVVTVQHKLHADSMPSVALYIIANVSHKTLDRLDFTYFPPFFHPTQPPAISLYFVRLQFSHCVNAVFTLKMKTKNTHSFFHTRFSLKRLFVA